MDYQDSFDSLLLGSQYILEVEIYLEVKAKCIVNQEIGINKSSKFKEIGIILISSWYIVSMVQVQIMASCSYLFPFPLSCEPMTIHLCFINKNMQLKTYGILQ